MGNRPITSSSSSDAADLRDHLFDKGLSLGSVKRIFGSVRSIIGGDYVVHSLRHSLRNRLTAVECPSDVIDQIGGWTPQVSVMPMEKAMAVAMPAKWMQMIEF